MIASILMFIAILLGPWGFIWRLWDHRSPVPFWLLGISMLCAVIGEVMS